MRPNLRDETKPVLLESIHERRERTVQVHEQVPTVVCACVCVCSLGKCFGRERERVRVRAGGQNEIDRLQRSFFPLDSAVSARVSLASFAG